jgi:hypothetical protein
MAREQYSIVTCMHDGLHTTNLQSRRTHHSYTRFVIVGLACGAAKPAVVCLVGRALQQKYASTHIVANTEGHKKLSGKTRL